MNPYWLGLYEIFVKQSFLRNEHLLLHKMSISIQNHRSILALTLTIFVSQLGIWTNTVHESIFWPVLIVFLYRFGYFSWHNFETSTLAFSITLSTLNVLVFLLDISPWVNIIYSSIGNMAKHRP